MKKILFILLLIILNVSLVKASELGCELLPYFVKINRFGENEKIIQLKKIYDKDTLNVLFNVEPDNYNLTTNFNVYKDINYGNYGKYYKYLDFFNTITYYGYNVLPNDLNYLFTQVMIWDYISNYNVFIVDEDGNLLEDLKQKRYELATKMFQHNSKESFFNENYKVELWTDTIFKYSEGSVILDNPNVDGLIFSNFNTDLYIYNNRVGSYNLEFTKIYDRLNYSYNDGLNIYWQNLGGPANLNYSIDDYQVYGTKLNITEKFIGVNDKFGDAYLKNKYELYLDNELKLVIDNIENVYVKSNSNYVLKDISELNGFYKGDDISFIVKDEEVELLIEKYVISKIFSVSVLDENTYYIYLKSNNELYEEINKETNLITLPYGEYYIIDKDNKYYQEIEVYNSMDEELIINNIVKDDVLDEENNDYIIDNEEIYIDDEVEIDEILNEKEEIIENVIIENNDEKNNNVKQDSINDIIIIDNPKTKDNIYFYYIMFVISISLLYLLIIYYRKVL